MEKQRFKVQGIWGPIPLESRGHPTLEKQPFLSPKTSIHPSKMPPETFFQLMDTLQARIEDHLPGEHFLQHLEMEEYSFGPHLKPCMGLSSEGKMSTAVQKQMHLMLPVRSGLLVPGWAMLKFLETD